MSHLIFHWYLLFLLNNIAYSYCPDDADLQRHNCICNLENNFIKCSSLPNQCRTCYRYNEIHFNDNVHALPIEAFRFYKFFDNQKKSSFKIEFAQINTLVSNSFSKLNISQDQRLEIKIFKYASSKLPTKVFEDIEIQTKSKLNIEILDVTSNVLTIEQHAFNGIKFHYKSLFRLTILRAKDTIQFESNAGSLLLPSYSSMELYFSNFIQVHFNKYSFHQIKQEQDSELIINFNYFQYAKFFQNVFFNVHQLEESRFHLSLLNFHMVTIEPILFNRIRQLKSLLIISIYNLTNNLCLPEIIFSQLKQDFNSTFQFEMNHGRNILFKSNSLMNINQNLQSKFSIMIMNSLNVYFSRNAFHNIQQENDSLIDISIKAGENLIFDDYAFNNMSISHSSILRVSFQRSRGTLQMAMDSFSTINQDHTGELVFQIQNSSNFYFRFNRTTSLKRLTIVDRSLSSDDFCRISNIPSHISVKLLNTYQCSCTVYYLYRQFNRKVHLNILNKLAPICYNQMPSNRIKDIENQCSFDRKIHDCQQMEGKVKINIPQNICYDNTMLNKNKLKKPFSFTSGIFTLIILSCLIFGAASIYLLFSNNIKSFVSDFITTYYYPYRRQRLPIFSADSYEELTIMDPEESNNNRRIIVKYDASTGRTEPCLDTNRIDFIIPDNNHQDQIIETEMKLNTNPINNIAKTNTLEMIEFI